MPNVYKPKLIQIRPQYSVETDAPDKPENILWFLSSSSGTPDAADLLVIANTFDTHWATCWGAFAGLVADYTGSIVTDWSSPTGLQVSTVGSFTPVAGTHGNLLPPQVAVLIQYQIALRFKGGHFRSYLPYIGESSVGGVYNDTVVTARVTDFQTQFNNLITAMEATGILGGQTFVVYKNKNTPATAETFEISTFSVAPIVATQRRRVRRVPHK